MTDRERIAKTGAKRSEIIKFLRENEAIELETTPLRPSPASKVQNSQHVQTGTVTSHPIADLESKCRELERTLQRTKLECRYRELQTQIETETKNLHFITLHTAATAPPATSNTSKRARKIQDYVWTGTRDLLDESKFIDIGNRVKLNVGEKKHYP